MPALLDHLEERQREIAGDAEDLPGPVGLEAVQQRLGDVHATSLRSSAHPVQLSRSGSAAIPSRACAPRGCLQRSSVAAYAARMATITFPPQNLTAEDALAIDRLLRAQRAYSYRQDGTDAEASIALLDQAQRERGADRQAARRLSPDRRARPRDPAHAAPRRGPAGADALGSPPPRELICGFCCEAGSARRGGRPRRTAAPRVHQADRTGPCSVAIS